MPEYLISQNDPRRERPEQMAAVKAAHTYDKAYGFPVAAGADDGNGPSAAWQLKAVEEQERIRLNLLNLRRRGKWDFVNEVQPLAPRKLAAMVHDYDVAGLLDYFMPTPGPRTDADTANTLEQFQEIFTVVKPPDVVSWCETDEYFAEMMVAGPDPTRLTRLDTVPGKFPITSEHLHSVPELAHETLESALAAGRVCWVDHESMSVLNNGHHYQDPKYIYSPMVAFAVPRTGGALRPFAIQCGQDPAGREIYTPADGYSWKLAKNCVLAAHNTYHGVLSHLAFTHLISEAVLLAAVRNLAAVHPVAVLLRRHFEGTMSINKLAVEVLIQPGRAVEYVIGSDLKSTYPFIAEHRKNFSFTGNYLPAKLARSGTDSLSGLPHYPYRDDGLLVWTAIRRWTDEFVDAYYRSDAEVREDHELQAWAAEVASPEYGAIRDFGAGAGTIADRTDLAEILTMVIWTAGPQHAAVNFTQEEHLSYLPANPIAGFTQEPRGRDHTLQDWLANLPPLDVAVQQLCTMRFLGVIHETKLGHYEDDFKHTPVADRLHAFQQNLSAAEDEIVGRNRHRTHAYDYLRPSLIPNSTNI
ncbi:lipoxygenase family protein [Streptomyces sp. NPDC058464]|uniref:lipoxygenase family protein n=1 Tax=Streptomyces sp. NPDC058464 TaxID=3346511 RepID=UPI0036607D19